MDREKREKIVREFVRFIQEYSRDVGCTSYDIEVLKGALALLQQPVAHGRWIETTIPANTTGHGGVGQDKKKGWLCSNCRCAFDAVLLWCDSFCPNCGAKMDGGAEL